MRALALVLMLLASSSLAQVAGLCGPGKNCKVKTLETTGSATTGSYAWALKIPNGPICTDATCTGRIAGTGTTGGAFAFINGATNYFTINPGVATYAVNFLYGAELGSGASGAGTAFSSFPAATAGKLLYDSTNSTWRYSNGTSWFPVGPYNLSDEFVIYFPGLSTLLNLPMSRWLAPRSIWLGGSYVSTFGTQIYSATTLVAGVGAGNAVFTIYNVSDAAATTATLTVPCAAAAGTVTASGSIDSSVVITTSAKTFELRLTTNGCTTLPTLNLNVRYTVLPPIN